MALPSRALRNWPVAAVLIFVVIFYLRNHIQLSYRAAHDAAFGHASSDEDASAAESETTGTAAATDIDIKASPTVIAVDEVPTESIAAGVVKAVIMGRLTTEDVTWVADDLPDWKHFIYTVNDTSAPGLHTAKNKGREGSPYLTFLIDHYANLPAVMAFIHPHHNGWPQAWHTDAEDHDNGNSLKQLNIDFVQRNGYANLRCIFIPGCPDEIITNRKPYDETRTSETNMSSVWQSFFGKDSPVPEVIATPCCAQFAVSRERVLERPKTDYEKYRQWLYETDLPDDVSGRILEYLWHVIFGMDAVYCPDLDICWCDVYNRCMH